ncbi:uncharacterized protein LOC107417109 [Ziziphus jujuba]|uniref:Uncharacterized protein LOC107417109 n=1 Tax=Ziziphus jujuba TaxID=326968 RepID=A0ABM4A705_ZIZJJ|nr:uncharacterized protein LOC107417109 [Ziziphus jujuba]
MGNYVSCTLSTPGIGKQHCKATKVIFPGGEVRQFYTPTKAAELMLEMPNFFVVNTMSLRIGRRFSALNADEDLEMGNVYVMFPMKRVNSVVTAGDMGALFITANSAAKQRVSGGKVKLLPESGVEVALQQKFVEEYANDCGNKDPTPAPKLNLDDIEEFSTPEFIHRMSMCRSKKPLLETIAEEPVWIR